MIQLTRLNGRPLLVNSDLIQHAEPSPHSTVSPNAVAPDPTVASGAAAASDTTLTFLNGKTIVVRESIQEIADRDLAERALASRARRMAEAALLEPGGVASDPVVNTAPVPDTAPLSALPQPPSEAAQHPPTSQHDSEPPASPPKAAFTRRRRSSW